MNPLMLVLAELRRGWIGALALMAVIALAVAMGVSVTAQERALRQGSARAAADFDLLVGAPGSQTQLALTSVYLQEAALPLMPGDIVAAVARRNGVAWMAPLAFGDSWRGRPIIGTTVDMVTRGGKLQPAEGRVFGAEGEAVVGAATGLRLGERITPSHGHSREDGHALPGETRHDGHDLTVVGRLPATGTPYDRAILVPIETVWEAHGLPTGRPASQDGIGPPWPEATGDVPVVVIKAASVADAYKLRASLRNERTLAIFPAEVLVELYATLGDVRDAMAAMAIACQILVLVAVLVCVLAVTGGRSRDMAVLRALGAPRPFIFAVVFTGVGIMMVAGCMLGLLIGWFATSVVSRILAQHLGFTVPASLGYDEVALVAGAGLAGLALALLPALRAYRASTASHLAAP